MENIWAFAAQTLSLSVTAVVLLIAKRLFLDKLSPRWQYGVWGIFALRALLPAGLLGRTLVPGGRVLLEAIKTAAELPLSSALSGPYTIPRVLAPVPLFSQGFPPPQSVTDLLFYVYAAGIAVLLLWYLLSYARLRAALGRGAAPAPEVLARVEAAAARYGLKMPRRVVVLPGLESAFVCGPIRPVLVLPDRDVDDKVLLHELLHLKHGDVWAGVGVCILRCLHWCNPLIWYCCNRIQNDCESLCDQRVLERLEGEERRAYGRILLSMADDRHARAPGTSSMANGGRNIKARIGAIARFKRYPAGMALASVCVAVVLALACLGGVSGAVAVPGGTDRGVLALAQARLNRPTTVAGALDTYAKAVVCDSPVYFSMVLPEGARTEAARAGLPPYEELELEDSLEDSPFNDLGFWWHRPAWQAEWSVMNLLSDGSGGYTGTLFFEPVSVDDTYGILYQQVAVRPEGDYWTVEPLEGFVVWPDPEQEGIWLCPSSEAPYITYTAEAGDLRIELDVQCQLWLDSTVSGSGMFFWSSSTQLDPVPRPQANFTGMRDGYGVRVRSAETGELLPLAVDAAPMEAGGDPAQALAEGDYRLTVEAGGLDDDPVSYSTGSYEGEALSLTAMPEAMTLAFTHNGQTYTCTAYPTEVHP